MSNTLAPTAVTTSLPQDSLSVTPEQAPDAKKLHEAAAQFEAIFVRQMLQTARKADFGDKLVSGQGLDSFKQMQDEKFADIAAHQGAFGIARGIERQVSAVLAARAQAAQSAATDASGSNGQ